MFLSSVCMCLTNVLVTMTTVLTSLGPCKLLQTFWMLLLWFILPQGISALSTILSSHFCCMELHIQMEMYSFCLAEYNKLGSNSCIKFFLGVLSHINEKSTCKHIFVAFKSIITETDPEISRLVNCSVNFPIEPQGTLMITFISYGYYCCRIKQIFQLPGT